MEGYKLKSSLTLISEIYHFHKINILSATYLTAYYHESIKSNDFEDLLVNIKLKKWLAEASTTRWAGIFLSWTIRMTSHRVLWIKGKRQTEKDKHFLKHFQKYFSNSSLRKFTGVLNLHNSKEYHVTKISSERQPSKTFGQAEEKKLSFPHELVPWSWSLIKYEL